MPVESITGRRALVGTEVNFKYHVFITIPKDDGYLSHDSIVSHVEEAKRWCNKNARGRWFVQKGWAGEKDDFNRYVVASFDEEQDAFIFKLVN